MPVVRKAKVYKHVCKTCNIEFTSNSSRSVYCMPEHNPVIRRAKRKDDGIILTPSHIFTPQVLEYERTRNFAIAKSPDLSRMKMVQVDKRTWIAVEPGRNEKEAIEHYLQLFLEQEKIRNLHIKTKDLLPE